MEVIAERPWGWMLFADSERRLLSVVCGGVGVYEIEFELRGDEIADYEQIGSVHFDELADAVRSTPTAFETRGLHGLLSGTQTMIAIDAWRKRQRLGSFRRALCPLPTHSGPKPTVNCRIRPVVDRTGGTAKGCGS